MITEQCTLDMSKHIEDPPELSLMAESRSRNIMVPRRFEKQYDFIDVNNDGIFLLGTSNMTGRIWFGSLWLFNDLSHQNDADKCLTGLEFDSGIPTGKWLDGAQRIVVGTDSGAIHILSLGSMTDIKKVYLSTLAILSEHDDSIASVDVSSDSQKILSGGVDMNIKLWDTESATSEKTYEYAHYHTVTSVSFQPGKQDIFLSTSLDGNALLWDAKQFKPASLILENESGWTAGCWIDDNCVALGTNCGIVSIVDIRTKSRLDKNHCSKRPLFYMTFDRDTNLLAVSADDPTVRVFSCSEKLLKNVYECERHTDFVRGLKWKSPNQLYSCAWDSKILLHEIPNYSGNDKISEENDVSEENSSAKHTDDESKVNSEN